MARKGNKKVRTGCRTCKLRKIKCDETKPSCERCTSTGRRCDGYNSLPSGSTSPSCTLINMNRPFPEISTGDESRALQYLGEVKGRRISDSSDQYFFNTLVMHFVHFEPAVYHSLIAISSLHEQILNKTDQNPLRRQQMALSHYNAAIRQLRSMTSPEKIPLILVVCILFIGIEMLQSNTETAIQHFKHGIELLSNCSENRWITEYVQPVFIRLSLFPYYFGKQEADFPNLAALYGLEPGPFTSLRDAQCAMDEIYSRTLRLMRVGDEYRYGRLRNKRPTTNLMAQQSEINASLDSWQFNFATHEHMSPGPKEKFTQTTCPRLLAVRRDQCRILVNMAFERDEMGYDKYIGLFEQMQKTVETVASETLNDKKSDLRPSITFEMTWVPILTFLAMKCRHLETRLQFWRLLPILGYHRESLWELSLMIPMVKRMIEIEHGLQLDESNIFQSFVSDELPSDLRRIRHAWIESTHTRRIVNEQVALGREVGFLVAGKDGNNRTRIEFIDETRYL